jgi:hypothetical protein
LDVALACYVEIFMAVQEDEVACWPHEQLTWVRREIELELHAVWMPTDSAIYHWLNNGNCVLARQLEQLITQTGRSLSSEPLILSAHHGAFLKNLLGVSDDALGPVQSHPRQP